jgi:LPS export ABC transporter protein LptC
MNAFKQTLWLLSTLIALSFWGWYTVSNTATPRLDQNTLSRMPDAIISGIRVSQFNIDGELHQQMTARSLVHLSKGNTHFIESPKIVMYSKNEAPWTIESHQAKAMDGSKKIIFSHQVVMSQDATEKTAASRLTTEELIYFPKKNIALSQVPSQLTQGDNQIDAAGFKAYLLKKNIQLTEAKAHYDPKSSHKTI